MIAGIDPGTTVGFAIIDLNGNLIKKGSQKELDRDELVKTLFSNGTIIAIGSDKAKIPSFVKETATKLGAKEIAPKKDLQVEQKRELTINYNFSNTHEMDAISAAVFAHRKLSSLIRKIKGALSKINRQDLLEQTAFTVIKERISIIKAIEKTISKENPQHEREIKINEPKSEELQKEQNNETNRLIKDNIILRNRNQGLQKEIASLRRKISELNEKSLLLVKPKTDSQKELLKEKRIRFLENKITSLQKTNESLSMEINSLEDIICDRKITPLPIIKSISLKESELLKANKTDTVFVNDTGILTNKSEELLILNGINLLITPNQPKKKLTIPFAVINEYELLRRTALIPVNELEKAKTQRELLARIVQEYKSSRQTI